jgi:hypothetical protein
MKIFLKLLIAIVFFAGIWVALIVPRDYVVGVVLGVIVIIALLSIIHNEKSRSYDTYLQLGSQELYEVIMSNNQGYGVSRNAVDALRSAYKREDFTTRIPTYIIKPMVFQQRTKLFDMFNKEIVGAKEFGLKSKALDLSPDHVVSIEYYGVVNIFVKDK